MRGLTFKRDRASARSLSSALAFGLAAIALTGCTIQSGGQSEGQTTGGDPTAAATEQAAVQGEPAPEAAVATPAEETRVGAKPGTAPPSAAGNPKTWNAGSRNVQSTPDPVPWQTR